MTAAERERRRYAGDGGAAVVWTLALVNVLLLVGLICFAVAAQALARQRAAAVADIAALAAASVAADVAGTGPCAAAAASVRANGMDLESCTVVGGDGSMADPGDVTVVVIGPTPAIVSRLMALLDHPPPIVTATARAGPPSP